MWLVGQKHGSLEQRCVSNIMKRLKNIKIVVLLYITQPVLHLIHSLSSWVCLMLCDVTGHGGGRWKHRRGVEREIHGPRGPSLQVPWTDERDPRAHGRKGQSNAVHLGPRVPSLGLLVCSRTFKNHYIRPHAEQVKLNLPQLLLK